MDYIKKNKLLLSIIGVLVVLNLVGLSVLLLGPIRPPGFGPRNDPVENLIDRELGFSQEQKTQYELLREEFFSHGRAEGEEEANAKEKLFDLLKNPAATQDQLQQIASGIGNLETHRSIALYEHFRAVRALCTPEQQRKFDEVISTVLKKMGGPPGPGQPMPPKER
jgi:protein CpxP